MQVWAGDAAAAGVPTVFGESIFDASEKVRLSDATAGDGTNGGAFFYDSSQTLRAGIGFGSNGPGAFFNDSTGTARLLEGVAGDDSSASFSMMNTGATHALFDLSALSDGSATTFQVKDGSGVVRATEGFSTVSNEIILLDDAANTETFRAPCTGNACP